MKSPLEITAETRLLPKSASGTMNGAAMKSSSALIHPRKLTPEASQSRLTQRKVATFARHRLRVLKLLVGKRDGETARHLRDTLKIATPKLRVVLRSLVDDGLIVQSWLDKHEREETGYRIWGPRE
jgi:hypothetical protein